MDKSLWHLANGVTHPPPRVWQCANCGKRFTLEEQFNEPCEAKLPKKEKKTKKVKKDEQREEESTTSPERTKEQDSEE